MAWNRKKILARLGQYLENKKIPFEYDEENLKIKLELYFANSSYMLYPYITIEDTLCSININVSEHTYKGFNFEKINEFNRKSIFFKAFMTEEGIVSLEYRFILDEIDGVVLDSIIDSLYASETLIDTL
ncbi:MAG: YbjN domain-containing protein [Roseburia sp.]|nr:YbjN domain-containing protein [Anaeroplasma bactoclasticum]MCM1196300.1 YbjN domain-containing protein [Roseburia sp.]